VNSTRRPSSSSSEESAKPGRESSRSSSSGRSSSGRSSSSSSSSQALAKRPPAEDIPVAGPNNDNTDWSGLADEDNKAPLRKKRPLLTVNLFWRSFGLIALLLCLVITLWVWVLDRSSQPSQTELLSQQLASVVNVSRSMLVVMDPSKRAGALKLLENQEGLRLRSRSPSDHWQALADEQQQRTVTEALRTKLGEEVLVAGEVNGVPGLWLGLSIGGGTYWIQTDISRLGSSSGSLDWPWLLLLVLGTGVLVGVSARLINRPLKELSFAASRIGDGEYDSHLDESNITNEIRMVNMGFNRMARELAKVEEERAVMLAGISHDLRTPLARLRLEAEISVSDEEARRNMASDIDQLDAIIDKFMDYARPDGTRIVPVNLTAVVEREAGAFRDKSQIRIESRLPSNLMVKGDDTELGRVFANLFENARRYGRSMDTGIARVKVSHVQSGDAIIVTVRDYGQGVAPEKLAHLTTPFFRGDAARTAATGAGLGLAVVKKAMQRIDGSLELNNATEKTGLVAHLRLKKALLQSGAGI